MIRLLIIHFILFETMFALSQIKIPLSTEHGIPFYQSGLHLPIVDGFDVDFEGNFYFNGDTTNTLVKYSPGGKQIFRRKYKRFSSNAFIIREDKIYLIDHTYGRKNLFILNTVDGSIDTFYTNITDRNINSFRYLQSGIVLDVFADQGRRLHGHMTPLDYLMFDYSGNFIKRIPNMYNLEEKYSKMITQGQGEWYIGSWKEYKIFVNQFDCRCYKIGFVDKNGDMFKMVKIYEKIFGGIFYGAPQEHWKIMKDYLYVLGKKENYGMVTKLSIDEIFSNEHVYTVNDSVQTIKTNTKGMLFLKEYLNQLSSKELILARNEVFARHGRKFKTKWIQEYFDKQTWYHPKPNYSDKLLNEEDKYLIYMIKKKEEEKKAIK